MDKREQLRALLVAESLRVRRWMIWHRGEFDKEDLETTITSLVVRRLRKRGRGLLHIDYARNEKKTGADIELWLRGGGFMLGLRLQAKALHALKRSDGIYGFLHHVVGKHGKHPRDQVDVLIEATQPPMVPMYLFYNGLESKPKARSGCGSMNGYAKKNGRLGMTVSAARVIQRYWPWGLPARHLDHVLPHSVPVQCLAVCDCPLSVSGTSGVALPLQALEWPLSFAGARPFVLLDPEFEVEFDPEFGPGMDEVDAWEERSRVVDALRESGVDVLETGIPRYVLELGRTGSLPEGAEIDAYAVALIDGDMLGDSDGPLIRL